MNPASLNEGFAAAVSLIEIARDLKRKFHFSKRELFVERFFFFPKKGTIFFIQLFNEILETTELTDWFER